MAFLHTAGACIGFQMTGSVTGAILAGSCWTAGLATLVEKKSRRMELAFYCLSRVGHLRAGRPALKHAAMHGRVPCADQAFRSLLMWRLRSVVSWAMMSHAKRTHHACRGHEHRGSMCVARGLQLGNLGPVEPLYNAHQFNEDSSMTLLHAECILAGHRVVRAVRGAVGLGAA